MRHTITFLFSFFLVLFTFFSTASAQERTPEENRARNLNAEAMEAYTHGQLPLAIHLGQRAFELVPDPSFAYNVGNFCLEQGERICAEQYLSAYMDLYPGADDIAEVSANLTEIRRDLNRTATPVEIVSSPPGAQIILNDEEVLGTTTFIGWIPSSAHTLRFELEGYETQEVQIETHQGVRYRHTAELIPLEPALLAFEEDTLIPLPTDYLAEPTTVQQRHTWEYVGIGSGVAMLATGGLFIAMRNQSIDEYNAKVNLAVQGQAIDLAELAELETTIGHQHALGWASIGAGGTMLLTGAGFLLLRSRQGDTESQEARISILPTTRGAMLNIAF